MNKKDNPIKTDERIKHLKEQYEKTSGLAQCIIVDIDGTLALMNGRHVFGSPEAVNDIVNTPIKELVNMYYSEDIIVILLSGRGEEEREITKKFLFKNNIWHDTLIMRKAKDNRSDDIVKKELYKENIEGMYHVEFILDDRDSVVSMWRRELKLPCLQVYYGSF